MTDIRLAIRRHHDYHANMPLTIVPDTAPDLAWPAVIQFSGQAELAYIHDQSQWNQAAHLQRHVYQPADRLIAADGRSYTLIRRLNNVVLPETDNHTVTLAELLDLVRAHAAEANHCCIAKLHAPFIADAIALLPALDD